MSSTSFAIFRRSCGFLPDGEQAVVRHEHRGAVADPLRHLVGELLGAGELVVGDRHVAADERLDLFDHARDRLCVIANIVQYFAWQWMTAWMSS